MPGSPYLEEPPKGLWTWPRIMKIAGPTVVVISVVAAWNGLLLEWMIFATIGFASSAFLRR
ncbi:MAG: hypothetical protein HOC79_09500 [Euryarchaeota archaeon]|nr:hypothetical protein [Euryarchaeota archaeon]